MKRIALLFIAGLMGTFVSAQELPVPSPMCKISQVVGLTNIDLEYSRPSMKGRTIFGDLVAYDKIWRLGANGSTKFSCDTEIMFGDQVLKPGKYSVFAYPSEKGEWKFVFNTELDLWGEGDYDETKTILTVMGTSSKCAAVETMSLTIENITANSGTIRMAWETTQVDVNFKVDTDGNAEKNIAEAIEKGEELDKVYYQAGRYYLNTKNDLDKAMENLDKSLSIKETHGAMFYKARVLKAKGETKDAIKTAKSALEMAKEAEAAGWIPYMENTIAEWEKE
ncbi:MAG: DUF2911 domain-containing protein [Crocinitomicaceae bacterium]|nr:DUF2911 domain-containing protein [Crocinitomicaceae bacterium]